MINLDSKSNLRFVSINCRGVKNNLFELSKLCTSGHHILFLQEHWLASEEIELLNNVHSEYRGAGISPFSLASGKLLSGRPFGGVACLWHKCLDPIVKIIDLNDDRLIGLTLSLPNRSILFINVYMPYCDPQNEDLYLSTLAKINSFVDDSPYSNIVLVGDFNAGPTNAFGRLLDAFCDDGNLLISDYSFLASESFTYISDSHNTTSWIDHCVTSSNMHQSISHMEVLHDFVISDHRPLSICLEASKLPDLVASSEKESLTGRVDWENLTNEQLRCYYAASEIHLRRIGIPSQTNVEKGESANINRSIDALYHNICDALLQASNILKCKHPKGNRKHGHVPGWNDQVKHLYDASRSAYLTWVYNDRPRHGHVSEVYRQSRLRFKYAFRKCKSDSEQIRANATAHALLSRSSKKFWSDVRKTISDRSPRPSLPSTIDGVHGEENITKMWETNYQHIFNSVTSEADKEFVETYVRLHATDTMDDISEYLITTLKVKEILLALKSKCAAGLDGVSKEHLIHAHPMIFVLLSTLFNMCLIHSYVPKGILATSIMPIIKDKSGDVTNKNNYRPISIATVFSKMLEKHILVHIESFLTTSDNQFGFKRSHGTDMCVFTLKEIIKFYNTSSTPVFVAFLDASKAFDRVNHWTLFKKLIRRNIPAIFLRLIIFWYRSQTMVVRWGGSCSNHFNIRNGTRQGSLISASLYAVFLDDLSTELDRVPVGCAIHNRIINHLFYADDSCIISPSAKGLNRLLSKCEEYAISHDIIFNPLKSKCMLFQSKKLFLKSHASITLCGERLNFVSSIKYLGVMINDVLSDDEDIRRQIRYIYGTAFGILKKFRKCTSEVKNKLFRAYCGSFYACQIWTNYSNACHAKLRVAYNNAYRILHGIPKWCSVRSEQVNGGIITFEALLRFSRWAFRQRCAASENGLIRSIFDSEVLFRTKFHLFSFNHS